MDHTFLTRKLHHACLYFTAAEHHRPLAGRLVTLPSHGVQKAESTWVVGYIPKYSSASRSSLSRTRTRSPIHVGLHY